MAATRAVIAGALDALNVAAMTDLARIGNGVPLGQSLPYVRVSATTRRFDTFGTFGDEVDLRVHVYTDHQGDDAALTIVAQARELLDDERGQPVKLAASGYTVLQVLFEGDQVMGDELVAGVHVRQRVALFTVKVQPA